MSTAQDCTTDTELEDLAFEVFCSTYGADWETAYTLAAALLPELIDYGFQWDFDVVVQAGEACKVAQ